MTKYYDISVPLSKFLPVWAGNDRFSLQYAKSIEHGDLVNDSNLFFNTHTGTHIDMPYHHLKFGDTAEKLNLEKCVGKVYVADFTGKNVITRLDLEQHQIPNNVSRLLFKTDNSKLWAKPYFDLMYTGLTVDAAQWLNMRNFELIGIDYLSIQKFGDNYNKVHQMLLSHSTVILEGLNLSEIKQGYYTLLCLPLNIIGAEGAPARAVLINEELEESNCD